MNNTDYQYEMSDNEYASTVFDLPDGYDDFLRHIKVEVESAQVDALLAAKRETTYFLTLKEEANRRRLKRGLLEHLRAFLLEMGAGFAFVGSQYPLEVSGKDYYLDLLFYHLRLRCFVIVDLKMGEFQPEFAGKMNFYLSAVDDRLRHPGDAPTIGVILCKARDNLTVEYALRNTATPIGVAEFTTSLPAALADSLPTVQQIEAELAASARPSASPLSDVE